MFNNDKFFMFCEQLDLKVDVKFKKTNDMIIRYA